jgi:hypothetical protein
MKKVWKEEWGIHFAVVRLPEDIFESKDAYKKNIHCGQQRCGHPLWAICYLFVAYFVGLLRGSSQNHPGYKISSGSISASVSVTIYMIENNYFICELQIWFHLTPRPYSKQIVSHWSGQIIKLGFS